MSVSIQRKRLNNLRLDDKRLKIVIDYLKSNDLPESLSIKSKQSIKKQFDTGEWSVNNDKLYYKPLNLEVIKSDDQQDKLTELYNNLEYSLGKGYHKFYDIVTSKYLNITRNDVIQFLKAQGNYQITRPLKIKKHDEPIVGLYPNHIWMADMMYMDYVNSYNPIPNNYENPAGLRNQDVKKRKYNRQTKRYEEVESRKPNFQFVFNIIDIFSKKLWSFPVAENQKSSEFTAGIFKQMFQNDNITTPKMMIVDEGVEFQGAFINTMRSFKIKLMYGRPYESTHQAHVERVNSTIRDKIRNYFVVTNDLNWVKGLDIIKKNYNNQRHDTTKFTPNEIWHNTNERIVINTNEEIQLSDTSSKEDKIKYVAFQNVKKQENFIKRKKTYGFQVGDKVRISMKVLSKDIRQMYKNLGDSKKISVYYSPEVYTIDSIVNVGSKIKRPRYILMDKNNQYITRESDIVDSSSTIREKKERKIYFFGSELMLVPNDSTPTSVDSNVEGLKLNSL